MGRAERNIPPLHLKSANMKIQVLLNRHAGSLKTIDADEFADYVREAFVRAGHKPDVRVIDGSELESALDAAATDDQCEVIGVCGGDGSVSCAAGVAWRSAAQEQSEIKLTYTDLLTKAVATALRRHPRVAVGGRPSIDEEPPRVGRSGRRCAAAADEACPPQHPRDTPNSHKLWNMLVRRRAQPDPSRT